MVYLDFHCAVEIEIQIVVNNWEVFRTNLFSEYMWIKAHVQIRPECNVIRNESIRFSSITGCFCLNGLESLNRRQWRWLVWQYCGFWNFLFLVQQLFDYTKAFHWRKFQKLILNSNHSGNQLQISNSTSLQVKNLAAFHFISDSFKFDMIEEQSNL